MHDASTILSPLTVQVANGNQLLSDTEFINCSWSVQNCEFQSNLKVLPLPHYDLIVGMDWLEQFSSMQIHWCHKWMHIPYQGQFVRLKGELPPDFVETMVEVFVLTEQTTDSVIPPAIQHLINTYTDVFAEPQGLPPSRSCDHSIPLTAGAQPFVIRPYRYPPAMKIEIEAQTSKMLQAGIIRPSSSPFSSSVVMTKKKDGS